ncbi:MAG: DNA recombination protein RmuC [Syntrophomonas sp.]|nr:DNA recombination protein RmuC [Syntrophomonas sp.]
MDKTTLAVYIFLLAGIISIVFFQLKTFSIINSWNKQAYLLSQLEIKLTLLEKIQAGSVQSFSNELSMLRSELAGQGQYNRAEIAKNISLYQDSLLSRMSEIAVLQKNQLDIFAQQLNRLTVSNEHKLDLMRQTIEDKIKVLQEDNNIKLEQMRVTVDEKLHATLETRLGESFKLVSERLEQVHKGLGEMQTLASGVGDLKKVLTNVKTRGIWGEIQLGNILEQVLSPDQYAVNICTRPGSNERVEYAIKLPGSKSGYGEVWLPIDAKFPQEDFLRLIDFSEKGMPEQMEEAGRQLEKRIKLEAQHIKEKYLDPPHTTDFGIMFLPTESLYAEVVKRPGLMSSLQNEFRVIITGPNTMIALLNSLAVGFRTIVIEKRSSEVWELLGVVKTEFGKFGDILDKTKKKLDEASSTIDSASRRSRSIERRLRDVQELPDVKS